MKRRTAAPLVLATVLTACAGPSARLVITAREEPIDVAFGKPKATDVRAPTGPTVLTPVPEALGVVPVPVGQLPVSVAQTLPVLASVAAPAASAPPSRPGPRRSVAAPSETPSLPGAVVTARSPAAVCPALDPFSVPRTEADTAIVMAAPDGPVGYLLSGSTTSAGTTTAVSAPVTGAVSKSVYNTDGSSSFELTQTSLGVTTVRDFASRPAIMRALGELHLLSISSTSTPGYTATYTPLKPLELLQIPPVEQTSFNDASSDPLTGTAVTYQAKIIGRERVNACGQAVDAWRVEGTETVTNPLENVTSTRISWYATQYGGLPVQEKITYSGTTGSPGVGVSGELLWSIAADPGARR